MSADTTLFDYKFQTKLTSWTPLNVGWHGYFNEQEIELLDRSSRSFAAAKKTVVVLSFENRFAALGGLSAVIRQLPEVLLQRGEKVVLLTPFHAGCATVQDAIAQGELLLRYTERPCNLCNYHATTSCYEEVGAPVPTYHIQIPGRFSAGDNPYGYKTPEELLLDALAFAAVVPYTLAQLGYADEHCMFHAHDWETAAIALTAPIAVISSVLLHAKTVLTLHNSFDSPFPAHLKELFFGKQFGGDTLLQTLIPFLSGPLSTVSTPFAHELHHDPLQRTVFADHLQDLLAQNPPLGVENGMFGTPVTLFSSRALSAAHAGNVTALLKEKRGWRKTFIAQVAKSSDPRICGKLAMSTNAQTLDQVPLFFMSGRLDPGQKGFDLVFNAFRRLPAGSAQLFFCPTLHRENDDLSFYTKIAEECSGNITIWPFRITAEEYRQILKSASYLLMPSLYEPFGAASEGFLHGTPVVARATGGLLAQVNSGPEFLLPPLYRVLFSADTADTPQNGLLFRENFPDDEAGKQWRALLEAPVGERLGIPLYGAMVDAAYQVLCKATALFQDVDRYGNIILNGLDSVTRYTWQSAADKYCAIYDTASGRGR